MGQPLHLIIEELVQLPYGTMPREQFHAMLLLCSIIAGTAVSIGNRFLECTKHEVYTSVRENDWEPYARELRARTDTLAYDMSTWFFSPDVLERTWTSQPHEKTDQ